MAFVERCQCTKHDYSHGFTPNDVGAAWCDAEAVTTVRLSYGPERCVNVWVCKEHFEEYMRFIDA